MNRPTMVVMAFVMLIILGASCFYVGRKMFHYLHLVIPGYYVQVFIGICGLIVLAIAMGFMPFQPSLKKGLVWFGWFLVGLFVLFLLFYVVSDIVWLVGKLFRVIPTPTPNTFTIVVNWIVLAAVACTAAFGTIHASQIKQASYEVQINKTTSLDGLKIVLISDLHIGYLNDETWLAMVVDGINALEPDIVGIAGDIFNDNLKALSNAEVAMQSLQSIRTTYGVYACLGNHDTGGTYPEMLDFLAQSNVKLLKDEYLVVEDKFVMVGRSDSSPIGNQGEPRQELSSVIEGVDLSLPIIVLDHNPANISEYGDEIDLILAGHTHKGQMFPANIITKLMYTVHYGYYQRADNTPHVVVTSGVGVWGPPFRIATNNEIVTISVRFQ